MNIINWILGNWFLVVVFMCFFGCFILYIRKFFKLPTNEQIKVIKDFIYTLVLSAEKELGSSTGQAKLATVIQKFYSTCPIDLRKFMTEKMIIDFIEESVERMKKYFENNPVAQENILKVGVSNGNSSKEISKP